MLDGWQCCAPPENSNILDIGSAPAPGLQLSSGSLQRWQYLPAQSLNVMRNNSYRMATRSTSSEDAPENVAVQVSTIRYGETIKVV